MELIMVMAVVALIIGGSMFLLAGDGSDKIHILPAKIEQLAKTSLAKAKLNKRTHFLLASPTHIWMSTDPEQEKPTGDSDSQIKLPSDCSIAFKRSGETQWQQLKSKNDKMVWTFSISGVCEEMSLMLEIDGSSAELRFHPLTAAIIKQ